MKQAIVIIINCLGPKGLTTNGNIARIYLKCTVRKRLQTDYILDLVPFSATGCTVRRHKRVKVIFMVLGNISVNWLNKIK